MPVGYAITVGLSTAALVLSVAPLGRTGWRGVVSWFISAIPNESPFLAVYWVAVSTLLAFQHGASPAAWSLVAAFGLGRFGSVPLRPSAAARPRPGGVRLRLAHAGGTASMKP